MSDRAGPPLGRQAAHAARYLFIAPARRSRQGLARAHSRHQDARGSGEILRVECAGTVGERLRELAELHKDGILSDDEFATAKAKLLGGL